MTKENHPSADRNPDPSTGDRAESTYFGTGDPDDSTDIEEERPHNEQVVDVLNELLGIARDGELGFQTCAHQGRAANLQQLFYRRAEQCHRAADELVQLIWRFGGAPAEGGTAVGAMHGGWIRIKEAVGADSDLSMLEECERREDAAMARYREALKQNLPPEVRSFVERQAQSAERNREQIRALGPGPADPAA